MSLPLKLIKIKGTPIICLHPHDDKCLICREKSVTESHHIVPKRITKSKGVIGDVRMNICEECHDHIHPERKLIEHVFKLVNKHQELKEDEDFEKIVEILSCETKRNQYVIGKRK